MRATGQSDEGIYEKVERGVPSPSTCFRSTPCRLPSIWPVTSDTPPRNRPSRSTTWSRTGDPSTSIQQATQRRGRAFSPHQVISHLFTADERRFFTYKPVAMAQSMKILSRLRLPSARVGEAIPQVRSPYTRGQSLTFNHDLFLLRERKIII